MLLKAFDYVIGGAQTVIEAIYEVAGYHTTIIMPAHKINQSCPRTFFDETLPKKWKSAVCKQTPALIQNYHQFYQERFRKHFQEIRMSVVVNIRLPLI